LRLVERHVEAGGDLPLRERAGRGEDHVVPGATGGQLRLQRLVLRVHVVVDVDADGPLEAVDRVLGDVVRPVVDVHDLAAVPAGGVAGTAATGGKEQGAGERGKAQGHGGSPVGKGRDGGFHAIAAQVRAGCAGTGRARVRAACSEWAAR